MNEIWHPPLLEKSEEEEGFEPLLLRIRNDPEEEGSFYSRSTQHRPLLLWPLLLTFIPQPLLLHIYIIITRSAYASRERDRKSMKFW